MTVGIYKITNKENGKVYVGQSENIEKRIRDHKCNCKIGINYPLYEAMRVYGIINFNFDIIVICDKEELNDLERYYILKFKSDNPIFGYNCTNGGSRYSYNDATTKKISEAKIGEKNPMYGKSPSKETLNKRSESLKKVIHTKEWHAKIGAKHKGKVLSEETKEKIRQSLTGYKHSDETKAKMSERMKDFKHSEETKQKLRKPKKLEAIYQYTIDNILINKFNSIYEASKETGIANGNILNVCKGRRNIAGGYKWSYIQIGE